MVRNKILLIWIVFFLGAYPAKSQTWAEWFKQKKTQRKYLVQQIAAMQVYLEYARKGYGIVKDGSRLIGDIKTGDFNLHNDHFSSLKIVNPEFRDSGPVQDIRKMYQTMLSDRTAVIKVAQQSKVFSAAELNSIRRLYDRFIKEADKELEELKLLTENGKLELSDDARIERIDKLYRRMQEKYRVQMQTSRKIKGLAKTRKDEIRNLETLKKLYGL